MCGAGIARSPPPLRQHEIRRHVSSNCEPNRQRAQKAHCDTGAHYADVDVARRRGSMASENDFAIGMSRADDRHRQRKQTGSRQCDPHAHSGKPTSAKITPRLIVSAPPLIINISRKSEVRQSRLKYSMSSSGCRDFPLRSTESGASVTRSSYTRECPHQCRCTVWGRSIWGCSQDEGCVVSLGDLGLNDGREWSLRGLFQQAKHCSSADLDHVRIDAGATAAFKAFDVHHLRIRR